MKRTATSDEATIWFHGSPVELTELRVGSTITQDRALARVFSHKPTLVAVDDAGRLHHNGQRQGFLYRITEVVAEKDITPVPGSTFPPGKEWLITRPLRVTLLERTTLDLMESLSPEAVTALRQRDFAQ